MTYIPAPQAAGSSETQSDKHTNKMIEQKKLTWINNKSNDKKKKSGATLLLINSKQERI